jgi:hypothetical protein
MLLPPKIAAGVADGSVTLAFRRWAAPRVKVGGRFLTSAGLIEITSVEPVEGIAEAEAIAAGSPTAAAVLKLTKGDEQLYRVGLTWAGPDPRVALRESAALTDEEVAALQAKLARLDGASSHARGPPALWLSSSSTRTAGHPTSPRWRGARRRRSRSTCAS